MQVFCKTYKLFFFLNFERKYFGWLSEKSQRGFQAAFYLSLRTFWRNFFWKFLHFCGLFFRSFPVIEREKFARPVKTAFFVSIKSFWKKLFWKTIEFSHHYQTLSWKFPASFRVFRRGCWNCILGVQGNILTKNSFISKFFFNFGHWASFLTNSPKKSSGVVKTGFSVSMETFGWKFFVKLTNFYFFEYRAENFRLAVRKKSAVLASCFLPLHRNTLKKKILKHFCIFCGLFFDHFR